MKAEIVDLKKIKLIAENRAETLIMGKWFGSFQNTSGHLKDGIITLTFKHKGHVTQ